MKNCEDIGQWIELIRNDFWHCCQASDKDVGLLKMSRVSKFCCSFVIVSINIMQFFYLHVKNMWIGVVNHVVEEDEWADLKSYHG